MPDLSAADLIVVESRPGWWSARCRHCGVWLSRFDFTHDDCVAGALWSRHVCAATPAPAPLTLFG